MRPLPQAATTPARAADDAPDPHLVARFVDEYEPALSTQQRIDQHLLRCFHLEDSAEWQRLVRAQ